MNVAQLVAEFGQRRGLHDLALPPRGPVVFSSDNSGSLLLEAEQEDLLLYALVPAPYVEPQAVLPLLQAVDLRRQSPQAWPVQVGGRGQGADFVLMLLVRLTEAQLNVQALEDALAGLLRLKQEHATFGVTP